MATSAVIRNVGFPGEMVVHVGDSDEVVNEAYMNSNIRHGDCSIALGNYIYHFTDKNCLGPEFTETPCTCILSDGDVVLAIGSHLPGQCPHDKLFE